jgi:hypothetical protein
MIKYVILGLVVIIILSYFGYDLKAIIEAPATQNNLSYAWGGVNYVWNNWLKGPITYVYKNIFIGILWKAFIHNLGRIDRGAPTELEGAGTRLLNVGNTPYQPIDR